MGYARTLINFSLVYSNLQMKILCRFEAKVDIDIIQDSTDYDSTRNSRKNNFIRKG